MKLYYKDEQNNIKEVENKDTPFMMVFNKEECMTMKQYMDTLIGEEFLDILMLYPQNETDTKEVQSFVDNVIERFE